MSISEIASMLMSGTTMSEELIVSQFGSDTKPAMDEISATCKRHGFILKWDPSFKIYSASPYNKQPMFGKLK